MTTERHLDGAFGRASPEHYAWQTEHTVVGERERSLVQQAFTPLGTRVLDIGCGEGATLRHLGEPEGATGLDLFEDKIAFARDALPRCRFVVGSAYDLPFEDGAFDHLIARDVVHHLDRPRRFVDECARVLAPGGRIDLLEPSRNNPLVFAHGMLLPVERGELRSTLGFLGNLLSGSFRIERRERFQAMPIHRILFHPDLGRPGLADRPRVRAAVDAFEHAAALLVPRVFWAYLHVRAIKPA
jgi:SAM-dependent methyltransferase